MGKRYFCDYCERSFVDDIDSRKKHLKGVQHEKIKKLHYASFRDLKALVEEERAKEECKRFKNTGQCSFGDTCNFTHYSSYELHTYANEVRRLELEKIRNLPTPNDWLDQRSKSNTALAAVTFPSEEILKKYNYRLLPPSLRPATLEQMKTAEIFDWG